MSHLTSGTVVIRGLSQSRLKVNKLGVIRTITERYFSACYTTVRIITTSMICGSVVKQVMCFGIRNTNYELAFLKRSSLVSVWSVLGPAAEFTAS